jgi:hypothetical protein
MGQRGSYGTALGARRWIRFFLGTLELTSDCDDAAAFLLSARAWHTGEVMKHGYAVQA